MSEAVAGAKLVAMELCKFARAQFREYGLRTSKWSYDDTIYMQFADEISRRLGPDGPWSRDFAKDLSFRAYSYLSIADQQLNGLQTLLAHALYSLPFGPVARSVAEASGRVIWLLDNELDLFGYDVRRRVARLFLDVEENTRISKNIAYEFEHPR